jgi:hypothetical protein
MISSYFSRSHSQEKYCRYYYKECEKDANTGTYLACVCISRWLCQSRILMAVRWLQILRLHHRYIDLLYPLCSMHPLFLLP